MKMSHVWTMVVGVLIAVGSVSCGSGGGGADSVNGTNPATASTETQVDAVAAWYVKARQ